MSNSRGFTLVEVIVALLILAVGLLAGVSSFASVFENLEAGHSAVAVSGRATELIEIARAAGCAGSPTAVVDDGPGVYWLRSEEINGELRLVTVVFSPRLTRSRADTFSAVLAC